MPMPLLRSCRIVEFGGLAPAAVGGHLADLGADVIKIEPASGDPVRRAGRYALPGPEAEGLMHLRWNRGKRSVVIDLSADGAADVFRAIVNSADALVEGARAGTLSRFGIRYEQLRADRPQLVYCSVSGTGASGPYAKLGTSGPWFDLYAGLAPARTDPAMPNTQIPIAMHAVGVYGALAVAAGIVQALRTGEGSFIDLSAIDVAVNWLPESVDAILNRDAVTPRSSYTADGKLATWPLIWTYQTEDGEAVFLAARDPKFRGRFFDTIGRPDLSFIDFDQPAPEAMRELWQELSAVFRTRTKTEWTDLLIANNIPGGPVNTMDGVVQDPHFLERDMTYTVQHPHAGALEFLAAPIKVQGHDFSASLPPALGRDSADVLREVGFTDDQIADLGHRGIVNARPR